MTRHESVSGPPSRAGHPPLWVVAAPAALLLVLAGCGQTSQQRGKSSEEVEVARYDIPTVGDKTAVGNAEPTPVGGVGLVEGLEGTGGDCPHDSYRTMLAENLRKQNVQNVHQLLNSPDCALVIVEGHWTPGAAKGDKIDIEVKLPPGSRATSLRGGVLRRCWLHNYDFAKNLRPDYNGARGMMLGHKIVVAEGPVITGGSEGDETAGAKSGRIWQGGRCLLDHPLALVMNPDAQQARYTGLISERINATFISGPRSSLDRQFAHASDNLAVSLRVPPQYRHNLPRFIRVVRAVPLGEAVDLVPKEGEDRRSYRQKLADDLLDPTRAIVAALRLEALGNRSVPALKAGLKSPHPLVRFASAESLAYLGQTAGCEELGQAIARYPVLRAYALSALASLDEAASLIELRRIVGGDLDDEARAGAFRALHLLNERDPSVQGERVNGSFWLHRVAPEARPMIHVSTTKRAEVALFGRSPALRPPFSISAGEFVITATQDSPGAAVSRVPLRGEPVRKVCALEVEEVVRTMAEFGASFSDVLAMLRQASDCGSVSCPVCIDALPQPGSVHELAKLGRDASGRELLPAGTPPVPTDAGGR